MLGLGGGMPAHVAASPRRRCVLLDAWTECVPTANSEFTRLAVPLTKGAVPSTAAAVGESDGAAAGHARRRRGDANMGGERHRLARGHRRGRDAQGRQRRQRRQEGAVLQGLDGQAAGPQLVTVRSAPPM